MVSVWVEHQSDLAVFVALARPSSVRDRELSLA